MAADNDRPSASGEGWLLETDAGPLAVAVVELLAVVVHPEFGDAQGGNGHSWVRWQGAQVPVLDLASRLGLAERPPRGDFLAVLRYATERAETAVVALGGIRLLQPPTNLVVADSQICPYPDPPEVWRPLALSCFRLEERRVPVANLAALFSSESR